MKQLLQPPGWPRPRGYANGVVSSGRQIFVAGQIDWDAHGHFASNRRADPVRPALANVLAVLHESGASPQHVMAMTWNATSKAEYLAQGAEIGAALRELVGVYSIAMSAVQVSALMEDQARVEIEDTAALPD